MDLRIEGGRSLVGSVEVPADKSITHRALMLGGLARGTSHVQARSPGDDNLSTARVLSALGARIERDGDRFRIEGGALHPLGAPADCGNSGTTMRLVSGIMAGAGLAGTLVGDASLSRRPMGRVCAPLREMGADVVGTTSGDRELPPLVFGRGAFRGGVHVTRVASAQVKSSLLLAGIASGKAVEVEEPALSRDHSERMLRAAGAVVEQRRRGARHVVRLQEGALLEPRDRVVPGDFSSAAFLVAAGLLVPGSRVTVTNVGLNPTRTGLLEILEELGAAVHVSNWHEADGEPVGDLTAEPSELVARRPGDLPTEVAGEIVPRLIDELVVLAAIAAHADGTLAVGGAEELRVKESDRVVETVRLLAAFGVAAEERPDGYAVTGRQKLHAADVDVSADHRLALTGAVLALAAPGTSVLRGFDIATVSYPDVVETLARLGAGVSRLDAPLARR